MQAVSIKPQQKQITGKVIALAICGFLMISNPLLCLPIGIIMPLFACPLLGTKHQWAAFVSIALPPIISLIYGSHTLFSISLIALCGLPLVATAILRSDKKPPTPITFLYYISAYALALLLVATCSSYALGGSISLGLAEYITTAVKNSSDSTNLLVQLISWGFISVPAGYQKVTALTFLLDVSFVRQLYLSLQLTLEILFTSTLPYAYVYACIIGGLFTALRVQKMHHSFLLVDTPDPAKSTERHVQIAISPGFSMLQLSQKTNWVIMCIGLVSLFFLSAASGTVQYELRLLCAGVFKCVYQLLGAAVAIGILSAHHSERKDFYGILVAALFVLIPTVLYMIGLFDPVFHFRSKILSKKEEE
ncbi:MAG: hypothetical protein GX096_15365 [Clostridiales bacterium]|nr:hypothetical protein [Clostridiales bacterium]